jgi:cytosine/adenosine deaminase-related metal-dependent hydrolase
MIKDGAVAVTDGTITAVGPISELQPRYRPMRTLSMPGGIVHPGFVESHVHVTQHSFRAAYLDTTSWEECSEFFMDFWRLVEDEEEHASSLLACLEMARNGTTAFLEGCGSVLQPDTAALAAEQIGIRASLGDPFLWDIPALWTVGAADRIPADLDHSLSLLGGQLWRNRDPRALVQGHVALVGHGMASDELERAAKACADDHGVILNQHQSYAEPDTHADDRRSGRHAMLHFDELGLLDSNTTFAHMNMVRDDELDPITRSGTSVVWCPAASMLLGVGGAIHGRHLELHQRGANVALGSDAPNYAGAIDATEQAFLALTTAREKRQDASVLSPEDVLEMATINGAEALGWRDRIGSIEVGKRADLVVRRADLPEATPGLDPVRSIMSSARSKSVDTVIVEGEVIVQGARSTRVDEEAVYGKAREAAQRLLDRMGRTVSHRWPVVTGADPS